MDTSKLRPFDLEKAKDGALFCHKNSGAGQAKYFCDNVVGIIGTDSQGRVFLELKGGHTAYKMSDLRMLPEVKKETFVLYKMMGKVYSSRRESWGGYRWADVHFIKEFEVEYEE